MYLKFSDPMNAFYGKLENWDWTLRRDTRKFSGCTWYETTFGKEKSNLEALSKKVNLMSKILARLVLRGNHKFSPPSGIRVKPKLHRRRRRIYSAVAEAKSCSYVQFFRLHVEQKKRHRSIVQSGSDDKKWSDSMEYYCYLRDDQDLLADGKSQNERRFGESF